jgi:thiol:disulfide interchange protein DsbD
MNGVKTFFGILLLAVALWIASPVLPGRVLMLICGAALLVGAVYLKLFERQSGPVAGTRRLAQGAGLVLAVLGVAQLVGALSGGSDPAQPLAHLARRADDRDASHPAKELAFQRVRNVTELDNAIHVAGRTVMLDFYADWCVSCKEMAHLTFNDPVVRNHLAEAVLLQADVTANTEEDKALMRRFGLFGPPGVLFFDGQGKERTAARVIGYLPPPRFAQSLQQAGL